MAIQASVTVLCVESSAHVILRNVSLVIEVGDDGSVAKAEPLVTSRCSKHIFGGSGGGMKEFEDADNNRVLSP